MTNFNQVLVYYNGGDNLYFCGERTSHDESGFSLPFVKNVMSERGQVCYLSGFHYHGGNRYRVYVFFPSIPSEDEIDKRRMNGLKRANLYYLEVQGG